MESKAFTFARYILENALLECDSLKYSNLVLATGAVFLVNWIFKNKLKNWSDECSSIVSIDLKKSKACAKELYYVMQKLDTENFTALKRKFSTRAMSEVSKYKIEKVKSK